MNDPSFDIHPRTKGSYRRRLDDIERALKNLNLEPSSSSGSFLYYYFASEKLARLLIGINKRRPASYYFEPSDGQKRAGGLRTSEVISAVAYFGRPICDDDLFWIFHWTCAGPEWEALVRRSVDLKPKVLSARKLRDRIVHDFGPTHALQVAEHAEFLVPKMKKFIGCIDLVRTQLAEKFARG